MRLSLLLIAAALFAPLSARADVALPDGTVIPALSQNLSAYLNGSSNNDNINEGINVITEAAVEPQKFQPQCTFNGKFIAKGGGANMAIGWYNVDDTRPSSNPPRYVPVDTGANLNTAAAGSDIQILFPFSSSLPPPGMQELSSASIRQSPVYKGGLIGLALVPNPNGTGSGNATQYHYTEHRFNTQCTQCSSPGPWYSILTYRSKQLANTFYLGFEDLDFRDAPGSQGINGNDLDYEDFLFRFTGLACPGAGQPCENTAGVGACRTGVTDCDSTGATVCRSLVKPGTEAEKCDGLDNDCNGQVDDGATCSGNQVCARGQCVNKCAGELGCSGGLKCSGGVCVEAACASVTCPAGELCRGGTCAAPCSGVMCPGTQVCRSGRCVDPCQGVTCAQGEICQSGACIVGCSCGSCPTGKACDTTTQRCVDPGCKGMSCPSNTHCAGGTCVDDCQNAVCPQGEKCMSGQCVAVAIPPDAGTMTNPGIDPDAGTLFDPDEGKDASTSGGGADAGEGATSGGCGCQSAGAAPLAGLALLLIALVNRKSRSPRALRQAQDRQ